MSAKWPKGIGPEVTRALDRYLEENPEPPAYETPMLAPWQYFPEVKDDYMGWRMGAGEDYLIAFIHWFSTISATEQGDYIAANPEPSGWEDFYQGLPSAKA